MSIDHKHEGRKAALNIVGKIAKNKPIAPPPIVFDEIVEALNHLSTSRPDFKKDLLMLSDAIKSLKTDNVDISPLVKAISGLKMSVDLDVSSVAHAVDGLELSVDLSGVERDLRSIKDAIKAIKTSIDLLGLENKLDSIGKEIKKGNLLLNQLVLSVRADRVVDYDVLGRIISIRVDQ